MRWVLRMVGLLAGPTALAAALVLGSATAGAHPLSTTAVLLDTGSDTVTGRIELPIDRLAIALDEPLTAAAVAKPVELDRLRRYVAAHLSATSPTDGAAWAASVTGGDIETIDGVDHVVFGLDLRPAAGRVRDFEFHYDAIVHRLLSHRIFVSSRTSGSESYTAVGVIDWESDTLTVPTRGAMPAQGFVAAMRMGIAHIAAGADHLLFLVMLLLPAPLLALGGRWVRTTQLRRNGVRVVHVVTAFALGHSLTLALAALGVVSVPTRVVEGFIALSILVSGLHALRPLTRGSEVGIALGFGLVHGLAFAAALDDLELSRASLITELLGFNLGIELTQLAVVALVMPSLMLLSRTRLYPGVRICIAGLGIILAAGWFAERIALVEANPVEWVSAALFAHPFVMAIGLAVVAALAWAVRPLRCPSSTQAPLLTST